MELARDNASLNGFEERLTVHTADLTAPSAALKSTGLARDGYHHVMANPPFYIRENTRPSRDKRNARSRAMGIDELDQWLRFLATAAKSGGTCTLIHTAEALPELLATFEGRFGGLRITPLYPRIGANAIRVIISGKKAAGHRFH